MSSKQKNEYHIFSAGDLIDGRFKVKRRLGFGRMGAVYECEHLELNNLVVALKVFSPQKSNKNLAARFQNELMVSYSIQHPNVVKTFEYITKDDLTAFTMEYIGGGDLADRLQSGEPLPISEVTRLGLQLCDGLQAIHDADIIHRDMKPENILLTKNGDVKITDFGIAKASNATRLTQAGDVLGTVSYISPEYICDGEVSSRSDIYSLGIIIYEMITGTTLYPGRNVIEFFKARMDSVLPDPPHILNPECPHALSVAVLKALSRNPDDRFQTASAFREAIFDAAPAVSMTAHVNDFDTSEGISLDASEKQPTELISRAQAKVSSFANVEGTQLFDASEVETIVPSAPIVTEEESLAMPTQRTPYQSAASESKRRISTFAAHAGLLSFGALLAVLVYGYGVTEDGASEGFQTDVTPVSQVTPAIEQIAEKPEGPDPLLRLAALRTSLQNDTNLQSDAKPALEENLAPDITPPAVKTVEAKSAAPEAIARITKKPEPVLSTTPKKLGVKPLQTPPIVESTKPKTLAVAVPAKSARNVGLVTEDNNSQAQQETPLVVKHVKVELIEKPTTQKRSNNKPRTTKSKPTKTAGAATTTFETKRYIGKTTRAKLRGQPQKTAATIEYQIKGTLLYKFADYIEWPEEELAASPTFDICLFGNDTFGSFFNKIDGKKQAFGRPFAIKRFPHTTAIGNLAQCEILYVHSSQQQTIAPKLATLIKSNVLVVTDGFTGGVIQFFIQNERVKYIVDKELASNAKLVLRSLLFQ